MTEFMLDLDAARREAAQPESLPITFKGETFDLPAEFPIDVLDPFLSDDFDLVGLIRDCMARYKAEDENGKRPGVAKVVIDTLFDRPTLPLDIAKAIFKAYELLFGAEDYARFKALRPTIGDYQRLTTGLFKAYGVSLGEVFASPDSSETDGATPKETSESTPTSTPEASGDAPASEGGSSE